MAKVKDLPGWVPQSSGAMSPGDTFPMHADQVTIERVIQTSGDHVMFSCRFISTVNEAPKARSVLYNFPLLDEKTLPKIVEILNNNHGETLLSIGEIVIPVD